MKKFEIKELGIVSTFKTAIYIYIIPMLLIFLIGLFATIIGVASSQGAILGVGIAYLVLPIFLLGMYGVISMLIALVYNKLSAKFGGLEVVLSEKVETNQHTQINSYGTINQPNNTSASGYPNNNVYPPQNSNNE